MHGHRVLLVLLQPLKLDFDLEALVPIDLSELYVTLDDLREPAGLLLRLDLLSRQSAPLELAGGYILLLSGGMCHESHAREH